MYLHWKMYTQDEHHRCDMSVAHAQCAALAMGELYGQKL